MSMRRWLTTPAPNTVWALTLAAASAVAGFVYVFDLIHRPMAPSTILDLEFAWTPERLNAMTTAWGPAGDAAARQSLWVDYGFMPAYALLFAGPILLIARAASGRWQTAGLALLWAPFAAWACDVVENVLLLSALPPAVAASGALLGAGLAAAVKFLLLAVSLGYVLGAGLGNVLPRRLRGAAG